MSWDPESPEYYREECSEAEARRRALRLLMDSERFTLLAMDGDDLKVLSSDGAFREKAIRAAHRVLEEEDDRQEWLR